jgi:hypothetical protein
MSPDRVQDVEEVVVDKTVTLAQIPNPTIGCVADIPHQAGGSADQHQKETAEFRVLGQVLLGDEVFAFPRTATDERNFMGCCVRF